MPRYKRFIEQVQTFAPVYKTILNPGASQNTIQDFKNRTGLSLPEDFLEFYEAANGGKPYETADVDGMCFHPLERILKDKRMFDEILAEKQAENEFFMWHKDWLPFADDFSYDTLVIDTSGKATGLPGCILNRAKDSFEEDDIAVVALSFSEYISGWVKRVLDEKVYRKGSTESGSENWIEEYEQEALPRLRFVSPKLK